jgi:hypothetical protein
VTQESLLTLKTARARFLEALFSTTFSFHFRHNITQLRIDGKMRLEHRGMALQEVGVDEYKPPKPSRVSFNFLKE